jgi:bidirectional [NiFe] hydrogenase diaphorase subunit
MSPQQTAVSSGQQELMDDPRIKQVDRTLKRFQYQQDALIEVLHTAQETFGYLDEDVLTYVAHQLKLPLSWVYGVATFYHFFSLKPQGEHICSVCMGTACYVKGSEVIMAALESEYGIKPGETTEDGKLSLAAARCVGSCGLAPVVVVDGHVHGKVDADEILQSVRQTVATSAPKPVAA